MAKNQKPEEKIIETSAIDQTAEPAAEEIPAEEAADPAAEEIPAEPAAEAADPAAEEAAPQGGTVTVQIVGKEPRECVIDAPMQLKDFLTRFSIPVNSKGGWRVYRDGAIIKGSVMVNPGDVLNVGKLNKNG